MYEMKGEESYIFTQLYPSRLENFPAVFEYLLVQEEYYMLLHFPSFPPYIYVIYYCVTLYVDFFSLSERKISGRKIKYL